MSLFQYKGIEVSLSLKLPARSGAELPKDIAKVINDKVGSAELRLNISKSLNEYAHRWPENINDTWQILGDVIKQADSPLLLAQVVFALGKHLDAPLTQEEVSLALNLYSGGFSWLTTKLEMSLQSKKIDRADLNVALRAFNVLKNFPDVKFGPEFDIDIATLQALAEFPEQAALGPRAIPLLRNAKVRVVEMMSAMGDESGYEKFRACIKNLPNNRLHLFCATLTSTGLLLSPAFGDSVEERMMTIAMRLTTGNYQVFANDEGDLLEISHLNKACQFAELAVKKAESGSKLDTYFAILGRVDHLCFSVGETAAVNHLNDFHRLTEAGYGSEGLTVLTEYLRNDEREVSFEAGVLLEMLGDLAKSFNVVMSLRDFSEFSQVVKQLIEINSEVKDFSNFELNREDFVKCLVVPLQLVAKRLSRMPVKIEVEALTTVLLSSFKRLDTIAEAEEDRELEAVDDEVEDEVGDELEEDDDAPIFTDMLDTISDWMEAVAEIPLLEGARAIGTADKNTLVKIFDRHGDSAADFLRSLCILATPGQTLKAVYDQHYSLVNDLAAAAGSSAAALISLQAAKKLHGAAPTVPVVLELTKMFKELRATTDHIKVQREIPRYEGLEKYSERLLQLPDLTIQDWMTGVRVGIEALDKNKKLTSLAAFHLKFRETK